MNLQFLMIPYEFLKEAVLDSAELFWKTLLSITKENMEEVI